MGRSYTAIEVGRAMKLSATWPVTAASSLAYFRNYRWTRQIAGAEIEEGEKEVVYKLRNGDFVSLEKEVSK